MPRQIAVRGFFIFLASLVQCFAQQTFTITHTGGGTYPRCDYMNCNEVCVSNTETWTIDRTTVFGSDIVHGTYQNTFYDVCPNSNITSLPENILLENNSIGTGLFYGNDGTCPHTFPTYDSEVRGTCVKPGSDTVNF